jgi:hypothetical protein
MDVHRVIFAGLSAMSLAGCAGPSAFHEIRRLRADVGLLDQRVTQLERVSVQEAHTTAWPAEPLPASVPTAPAAAKPSTAATSTVAVSGQRSKKEIQQALKNAGFYQGPIDGKIGPQTQEAIKQFQQANGLQVDGKVGRHTWAKLAPYLNLATGSEQTTAPIPQK